jgi:hypothetical protein
MHNLLYIPDAKFDTVTVNTNIRVTEIQPGMVETGKLAWYILHGLLNLFQSSPTCDTGATRRQQRKSIKGYNLVCSLSYSLLS